MPLTSSKGKRSTAKPSRLTPLGTSSATSILELSPSTKLSSLSPAYNASSSLVPTSPSSSITASAPPVVSNKVDKQSLCLELLQGGHINSFIDFFYLTHKQQINKNKNTDNNSINTNKTTEETKDQLPHPSLSSSKEASTAEASSTSAATEEADDSDEIFSDDPPPVSSHLHHERFDTIDPFGLSSSSSQSVKPADLPPIQPIPTSRLSFLADTLSASESAHRIGNLPLIFSLNNSLSQFFYRLHDYSTAIYFQDKNIELAEQIQLTDHQHEIMKIRSLIRLGQLYQKYHNAKLAIYHYEKCGDIIRNIEKDQRQTDQDNQRAKTASPLALLSQRARSQLVGAYHHYALDFALHKDYPSALLLYQKCHSMATALNDSYHMLLSSYYIGLTYYYQQQHTDCITYLQSALILATSLATDAVTGSPHQQQSSSTLLSYIDYFLALSYLAIEDHQLSLSYLQQCHGLVSGRMAGGLGSLNEARELLSESICKQGEIQSVLGNHHAAMLLFEQGYEISKKLKGKKRMDLARINVGMARGNVLMKSFMGLVKTDDNMAQLLNWKTKRQGLKIAAA